MNQRGNPAILLAELIDLPIRIDQIEPTSPQRYSDDDSANRTKSIHGRPPLWRFQPTSTADLRFAPRVGRADNEVPATESSETVRLAAIVRKA